VLSWGNVNYPYFDLRVLTVLPDGSSCRTYYSNTDGCPGVVHEINSRSVSFSTNMSARNNIDITH
jgi:hypothetical protein